MQSTAPPVPPTAGMAPHSVAVIGATRTVYCPGGSTGTGGVTILPYVPPGIMSDPGWLLDRTADLFATAGEGTLITRYVPLSEWGADPRPARHQVAEFITRARTAGWACSDAAIDHDSGWITFSRDGRATVHLGALDAIAPDQLTLFGHDDEPETIARRLAAYQSAVGVPYRTTPGVAGLAVLREHYANRPVPAGLRRKEPRWKWWEPDAVVPTPGDLLWSRPPTAGERAQCRYVHAFDVNAQYLAAASAALLAWTPPTRTGAMLFDPDRAGLWRIVARASVQWGSGLPPFLNPAKIESDGTGWVTTPVMVFLSERGVYPEVLDSWTADGKRLLRPWAERLRNARAVVSARACTSGYTPDCRCDRCALLATVKQTYTFTIGLMDTRTARVTRPDWAYTIRDLARVNLLRKLTDAWSAHGHRPLRVHRDCVWYADTLADPGPMAEHLGVDPVKIGKFKIERRQCMTMAEYLDREKTAAAARRRTRREAHDA